MKTKRKKYIFLALFLFIIFLFNNSFAIALNKNKVKSILDKEEPEKKEITITATGDMMYHDTQLYHAFNGETYDFSNTLDPMKEYIDRSDLMLANFETTVNPDVFYQGYPTFNSPPEVLDYAKKLGFDAFSISNNHALDLGKDGIRSTMREMQKRNIDYFGGSLKKNSKPLIKNVNGIKVALLSYSSIFNTGYPEDEPYLIDNLDRDKVRKDIKYAKKHSDVVVCYTHWGNEYETRANYYQKEKAKELSDLGVDLIFGSHPHVPQECEWINGENGNKTFVIYSMGNLMSGQTPLNGMAIETEYGVFVEAKIKKENGKTKIEKINLIPTYNHHAYDENNMLYGEVFATKDCLENGKYYNKIDDYSKQRAYNASINEENILTDSYKYK